MTLTLKHTAADGTLLRGTSRDDGSSAVLRGVSPRWWWGRGLRCWYVRGSREHEPDDALIRATETALRAAGFAVEVAVDASWLPAAHREANRTNRAGERAAALEDTAAQHAATAATHRERARQMADDLPLGQPDVSDQVRRFRDRMHAHRDRSLEHAEIAATAAARAAAARHTASGAEARITVANRLERASAEVRRNLRTLLGLDAHGRRSPWVEPVDVDSALGQRLCLRIAGLTDQRLYDAAKLAALPAPVDPTTVNAGDVVRIRGCWYRVVRPNQRTVTVPNGISSGASPVPWADVAGHHSADAVPVGLEVVEHRPRTAGPR